MANLFELFGTIAIQNQEANAAIDETITKAKELNIVLSGSVEVSNDASEGVEKVGKTTEKTSNRFGVFSVAVGNFATKAISWLGRVGKTAAITGFEFNASIESYQKQFEALLQDEGKAAKLVDDIRELAKVTPLGMEGLTNNAVLLLSAGVELENIIPTLETIGNLSLGDQNKMNSLVRTYTQVMGKGRLLAQEINQLGDAGVPIKAIMTEYGGEKYADGSWWEQKMSNPDFEIPFEDFDAALRAATAEGGKWHNYMFAMMDTWAGQTDRLGEETKETLGDFFKPFFDVAKSDVLPKLIASFDRFSTFLTENKELVTEWANALGNFTVEAFDGLINLLEWMIQNKDAVAKAFEVIGGAIVIHLAAAHPYLTAIVAAVAAFQTIANQAAKEEQTYQEAKDKFVSTNGKEIGLADVVEKDPNNASGIIPGIGGVNRYETISYVDKKAAEHFGIPVPDVDPYGNYIEGQEPWVSEFGSKYWVKGKEEADAWWASLPVNEENLAAWEKCIKILTDASISTNDKIEKINQLDGLFPQRGTPNITDIKHNEDGTLTFTTDLYNPENEGHGTPGTNNSVFDSVFDFVTDKIGGVMGGDTASMITQLSKLNAKLDTVINQQAQGKTVVLNTGALVGGIGGAVDQYLGRTLTQKTRG